MNPTKPIQSRQGRLKYCALASAVPNGTIDIAYIFPGLRPGLSSVRPFGTRAEFFSTLFQPGPFSKLLNQLLQITKGGHSAPATLVARPDVTCSSCCFSIES